MPPHPGFKFFCFWRTLCTNPSLRMPPHYEYHQMLECSWNASPLKLLSTSISAIRTLPPWNCFASISAVRMFRPWNGFLPEFHQLERFPLEVAFTQAFQQLECFSLKMVFLPAFQQLECFSWNCFLPVFQQIECFPPWIAFYQHFIS